MGSGEEVTMRRRGGMDFGKEGYRAKKREHGLQRAVSEKGDRAKERKGNGVKEIGGE